MSPTVIPLVDEGLGNSAYVVDLGDGRALAVDASRDLRALQATTERLGLTVAFAADTHLHADFLSGAVQLAAGGGATVLASANGGREFPHRGLADGDEVDLGGLTLRALATPGHTHEHTAFALLDDARVVGVFTGGSLLVGSAARTDLVSPERTEELARAQYRSLQRLALLDDDVAVWPTHGAGSFCSAPAGAERTSTIGRERGANPLLRATNEDNFVDLLLASLGSFPPYFTRLGEINRRGPSLVSGDELNQLTVAEVRGLLATDVQVVDVRPVADFAAAHIRGSISIALRPVFATWLGWVADAELPTVIVRAADQDPAEIVWQARKVGYDRLVGELADGITAWVGAGEPTMSLPLVEPGDVGSRRILDIRQDNEFAAGHLPGAAHVELGAVATAGQPAGEGPLVVMCGHSERAATGASLLARSGRRDLAVLNGGPGDWANATGEALEVGP